MSYLDNLESSLKNLESREERAAGEHLRRHEEKAHAVAVGPWAERLKSAPFTQQLFEQAALTGHRLRTKIYMAWFDSTLRLEARQRTLELRPTAQGISGVFIEPDGATTTQAVHLDGDPAALLRQWLG